LLIATQRTSGRVVPAEPVEPRHAGVRDLPGPGRREDRAGRVGMLVRGRSAGASMRQGGPSGAGDGEVSRRSGLGACWRAAFRSQGRASALDAGAAGLPSREARLPRSSLRLAVSSRDWPVRPGSPRIGGCSIDQAFVTGVAGNRDCSFLLSCRDAAVRASDGQGPLLGIRRDRFRPPTRFGGADYRPRQRSFQSLDRGAGSFLPAHADGASGGASRSRTATGASSSPRQPVERPSMSGLAGLEFTPGECPDLPSPEPIRARRGAYPVPFSVPRPRCPEIRAGRRRARGRSKARPRSGRPRAAIRAAVHLRRSPRGPATQAPRAGVERRALFGARTLPRSTPPTRKAKPDHGSAACFELLGGDHALARGTARRLCHTPPEALEAGPCSSAVRPLGSERTPAGGARASAAV